MRKKITQKVVQTLTNSYAKGETPCITENGQKKNRYEIRDTLTTGFLIRVNKTRATYMVNYARGKFHKIGYVDVHTLDQARNQAKEILVTKTPPESPAEAGGKSVLTFGEFVDGEQGWGEWVTASKKSGLRTRQLVTTQFGYLFDRPLAEITAEDLDKWRIKRLSENRAPSTINRQTNAIRSVFALAEKWGRVTENPLQGFGKLKEPAKLRARFLSEKEEKRLRAALRERDARKREQRESNNLDLQKRGSAPLDDYSGKEYVDYLEPAILLSMNTGLRRGELMQLTWGDITANSIHVPAEITKGNRDRHIPLNKEAREVVSKWRQQSEGEALIPVKFLQKAWERVLKGDARIDNFRWHDLRHHFASMLVKNGVPLNTVRELLGHANIDQTIRYAHLAPEHLAEAVELIGGGANA